MVIFGRDMAEVDRRLAWRHDRPEFAGQSLETVIEASGADGRAIVGTPDMLVEQSKAYADAGVEELVLQWFGMDDIDGLQAFATSVLPRL